MTALRKNKARERERTKFLPVARTAARNKAPNPAERAWAKQDEAEAKRRRSVPGAAVFARERRPGKERRPRTPGRKREMEQKDWEDDER